MDYELYMRRALYLAKKGMGFTSPNPMVGAVIVDPYGKIIGEGWHRKFGEAHAEVNACRSVRPSDEKLIPESTIFITLEPCSHHGKTPPCADLLIRKGFKKVVIGAVDPFVKVDGTGIRRLKKAGIEVMTGVLEEECRRVNRPFFFAHSHQRPYVTIKWAQSKDGYLDSRTRHPYPFSNVLTRMLVHRLRSHNDAIITSTSTAIKDNPRLNTRHYPDGKTPVPIIAGKSQIPSDLKLSSNPQLIKYQDRDLSKLLRELYNEQGFISVLVEGGPEFLNAFIETGLWNEIRVEVSPIILGDDGCCPAPHLLGAPSHSEEVGGNMIYKYFNYE